MCGLYVVGRIRFVRESPAVVMCKRLGKRGVAGVDGDVRMERVSQRARPRFLGGVVVWCDVSSTKDDVGDDSATCSTFALRSLVGFPLLQPHNKLCSLSTGCATISR